MPTGAEFSWQVGNMWYVPYLKGSPLGFLENWSCYDSDTFGDIIPSTFFFFFMIFLFMLPRRSPCLTSDQERSLALGSLPLSSFSSSYSSSPLGKKSNLGKTQTRAQGLRQWWACQLFPRKPATCCTRLAWGQKGLNLKPSVCRVHRGQQAPMVRWEAAPGALPRSWCVQLPTPLFQEVSASPPARPRPVRAVRYAKVCIGIY